MVGTNAQGMELPATNFGVLTANLFDLLAVVGGQQDGVFFAAFPTPGFQKRPWGCSPAFHFRQPRLSPGNHVPYVAQVINRVIESSIFGLSCRVATALRFRLSRVAGMVAA
jgi:hypothetical protein